MASAQPAVDSCLEQAIQDVVVCKDRGWVCAGTRDEYMEGLKIGIYRDSE